MICFKRSRNQIRATFFPGENISLPPPLSFNEEYHNLLRLQEGKLLVRYPFILLENVTSLLAARHYELGSVGYVQCITWFRG